TPYQKFSNLKKYCSACLTKNFSLLKFASKQSRKATTRRQPMYLHPEKINSAQPLPYPGLPEREELRKRTLDVMRRVVLNDLQQGVPALSEAFAQFCADRFDNDLRYLLCLSSVTQAKGALAMTNKWVAE